ncbi:MAG: peptide chain release factor 1 [Candidatus Krumholzibacteria bacterium]|nr:peptide chain release factor 1 [Candidatus Krumholzibacteria bacterium]
MHPRRNCLNREERYKAVLNRHERLGEELAKPATIKNQRLYRKLAKEHNDLGEAAEAINECRELERRAEEDREVVKAGDDPELASLAESELEEIIVRMEELDERIKNLLIPRDPDDTRNIVFEIRAGTGGNEASLFAADLARMYRLFAESNKWKVEVLSSNPTEIGGYKEIILLITGQDAYGRLKFERGVHRVQRVPVTESGGRIHTSAVSVAVLPEAEEVDVKIDPKDLRIDVYRSSGPGGQSVNTTDSAVRVTHVPTGMVVTCQDEKSQHKNKAKALKVLRARLLEKARGEQEEKIAKARRTMIGSGDRSAKIRTYNFPQGRVTDHRIGLTLHSLDGVLDGDLGEIIEALSVAHREELLSKGIDFDETSNEKGE